MPETVWTTILNLRVIFIKIPNISILYCISISRICGKKNEGVIAHYIVVLQDLVLVVLNWKVEKINSHVYIKLFTLQWYMFHDVSTWSGLELILLVFNGSSSWYTAHTCHLQFIEVTSINSRHRRDLVMLYFFV